MLFRLAADAVLLLHLAFILFALCGAAWRCAGRAFGGFTCRRPCGRSALS